MTPAELINTTLDALDRLLRSFRVERYCYLGASIISFGVMIVWVCLAIRNGQVTLATAGVIFGANSFLTAGSIGVTYFFQKGFSLLDYLVRASIDAGREP